MAIDVAQGMVDKAFSDQSLLPTAQNSAQMDPLAILSSNATTEGGAPAYDGSDFAKDMFGVEDPNQLLRLVGPHPNDPNRVVYEMNGKKYGAQKDTPVETVLQNIWEKHSPTLWGSAVGSTLYGLPSDMASAVAYGLGGLNLGESAEDWRNYSDKLKEEYNQKYGQFTVPGIDAALKQGKVWDYAMQTIGAGTPYMGLALAGGIGGGAAVGAAGVATTTAEGGLTLAGALGSFLGSTAVTSPVTIAQFADRQVAEQKAQGIENPEIDWGKAAALGTIAAGLQAVPAESILFGGPLLKTLEAWGAKTGTSASARMLASIADVAGSNALAGAGIASLSRFNADMPMLDDNAKSEYLDAAIAGSLVGIPFGAYKGWHTHSKVHPNTDKSRPVDEILKDVGEEPDRPNGGPKKPEGPVYTGPDDFNTTLKLPKPDISPIFDSSKDYGINSFQDAYEYLNSVRYKRPDGTEGNGLQDFASTFDKAKRSYSDEDMINAARRAKWARDRQGNLARAKDGMMYETIDDLPQKHSEDPLTLTKAAALTDKFGYDDTFVRGLSDNIIDKLYERNVAGELGRAAKGNKYSKEIFDEVMGKLKNKVDEDVIKDVREYGSLYQRPQSRAREKSRLSSIRARVNRNPRADLAEALMNTKWQKANKKASDFAKGEQGKGTVNNPDFSHMEQPREKSGLPVVHPFYGVSPEELQARDNLDLRNRAQLKADLAARGIPSDAPILQPSLPTMVNPLKEMKNKVGDAQRDLPERAMLKYQNNFGGGVFSHQLEHIGDISHRITEMLEYGQFGAAWPKIERGLRALKHPYGFMREHQENLKSNYDIRSDASEGEKGEAFRKRFPTLGDYVNHMKNLAEQYSQEHEKLPVFNEAQYHAREAAVALGRENIPKAIKHLEALEKIFQGDKNEVLNRLTDYRYDKYGNLKQFDPNDPSFKQKPQTVLRMKDVETTYEMVRDAGIYEKDIPSVFAQGVKNNKPDTVFGRDGKTMGDIAREASQGWFWGNDLGYEAGLGWAQMTPENLAKIKNKFDKKVANLKIVLQNIEKKFEGKPDNYKMAGTIMGDSGAMTKKESITWVNNKFYSLEKEVLRAENQLRRAKGLPEANYKSIYVDDYGAMYKFTPEQWRKMVAKAHAGEQVNFVDFGATELKKLGKPYYRDGSGEVQSLSPETHEIFKVMDWREGAWRKEHERHLPREMEEVRVDKGGLPMLHSFYGAKPLEGARRSSLDGIESAPIYNPDFSKVVVPPEIKNLPILHPFYGAKPEKIVETLVQASVRPGNFATKRMTKQHFAQAIFKTPFFTNLMKVWTGKDPHDPVSGKPFDPKKNYSMEEAWDVLQRGKKEHMRMAAAARAAEKKAAFPEPKLDAAGDPILKPPAHGGFRPTEYAKEKPFKFKMPDEGQELLNQLNDRFERMVMQEREHIIKSNPALGPALNQMAKAYAELRPETKLGGPTTKVIKGKSGLIESLARRAKIIEAVERSLKNIGSGKAGEHFSGIIDAIIGGKEVTPRDLSDAVTYMETALHMDEKGNIPTGTLDVTAVTNMYKTIRGLQGKKSVASLESKRQHLEDWYKSEYKLNEADLAGIRTEDIEAAAFYHYLNDSLKANFKSFKKGPHKAIFESVEKGLKKLKNDLETQGYKEAEDFFEYNPEARDEKIPPGAQASETAKRVINDANAETAKADLGKQQERVKKSAAEREGDAPPPPQPPSGGVGGSGRGNGKKPTESKVYGSHVRNVQSGMYRLWSTIASVPYLARHIPEWAIHFNDFEKVAHEQAAFDMRFTTKMTKMMKGPKGDRIWQEVNDAANLVAHMRKTDQILEKDAQGRYLIKGKDGEQKAVSLRMTEAMDDIFDFNQEVMRAASEVSRKHIGTLFAEDGITSKSSIDHIKRVLKDYDNRIDGNPFPLEQSRLRGKRDVLSSQLNEILGYEEHLNTKIPYVPFLRFGDHVVQVVNRKTGKTVHNEPLNDFNKISHHTHDLTEQEAQQKINDLGLRQKYNSNEYEIRHFKMTYDNIAKHIGRNAISTELLQGLIASGLNDHIKLADHLATDVGDFKEIMKEIKDSIKGSKDKAIKYMSSRGVGKFSLKSENIDGHSTDWARVFESYKNVWASNLGKKMKMLDMVEHQAALQEKGYPAHLRNRIEKYLDYVNSPEADYAGLRSFNFIFAMGFNPASAILQLATLPNQVLGASLEFSYNMPHNAAMLSNEFQRAFRYVMPNFGMKLKELDPYYESIINSEPGFFRASVKHDAVANSLMGNSTSTSAAGRFFQKLADTSAVFISPFERVTRIASFSFLHRALKENPENMNRFIKAHEKDSNWQQFYENYKDKYDNETIGALYKMQETHAVFGKPARGELQKGLGGSLFFPFSSYGQQMLEVMADQTMGYRGTGGRAAAMWSTTAFVAMAGMAGIPAYELLKTLYEVYEEKANGRIADAEMDMKEAGLPDWLRKGLLSDATGLSLSHRLGQTLVGESILEGIIKGEMKVGDLGGVPGRVAQNTITAAGSLLDSSDNRDVIQKLLPIMPTAMANLAKAYELTVHPENQLRTAKGKSFLAPEDVNSSDVIAQGLGFTPQKFEDARQKLHWQQQANVEFNQARSRFAESVAQALYSREVAMRNGDTEAAEQALLQRNQLQKTMLKFMKDNQIAADGSFWSSFNRNVHDRLLSKRFPGKILKPTRGELRHLDVLQNDTE